MEFTLLSAEGVPDGSVLSIKLGDTKRQGLASKIGQPFRFASSPAEPLPMRVEILSQAAPAQTVAVSPFQSSIVVDFGGHMKVTLAQRLAPELQRPLTEVSGATTSKTISADKMETAQVAATYLEQHDLVRTFQDILHGLLVVKPTEPFSYLEEHVARAKAIHAKKKVPGPFPSAVLPFHGFYKSFFGAPEAPGQLARRLFATETVKISGSWLVVGEGGGNFIYSLNAYEDGEVTGQARAADAASWTTSLLGKVVGRNLSWTEFGLESNDQLGEFSCVISHNGDSLSGSARPVGGGLLQFTGSRRTASKSKKAPKRGSIVSRSKVDALLEILHRTNKNLPLIAPMLPQDLIDTLESKKLKEECVKEFKMLAGDKGMLGTAQLLPVVLHLTSLSPSKAKSVGDDQTQEIMKMFDTDGDGCISMDEFIALVQFVMVSAHLESDDGQKLLETVKLEESRFKQFLEIMESDRNRINDVVPFLPDWLVAHLTSDDFMDACHNRFDDLDMDGNGMLEPTEILPVVVALTKIDPNMVDNKKLLRFVKIFDVHNNGSIMRDEFIDFTQFMAVMNFLETTIEGEQVFQASLDYADLKQLKTHIAILREDWTRLSQVYSVVPKALFKDISSNLFADHCNVMFREVDVDKKGAVEASKTFPMLTVLCAEHPIHMDEARCQDFFSCFDKEKSGVVRVDQVVELGRFFIVLAYFTSCYEWHDTSLENSKQRIEKLLEFLKKNCERLDDILPFLPQEFSEELLSYDFERHCMEDFKELDKDRTGVLRPKELIPVILHLSKGHQLSLTSDHIMEFVTLFDTGKNGVITPSEFVNLSRFMMILAYLETEEGKQVADVAEMQYSVRQVEELFAMLKQDRSSVHKIVPLLPAEIYDDVTSDAFVLDCQDRFAKLDHNKSGTLEPEELYPVIVELSQAHSYAIDYDHCKEFATIFDINGDGIIHKDAFTDFVRFLYIMQYMHSDKGRQKMKEGLAIMDSSRQVDELLHMLEKDKHELRKVIPYLPDDLRAELMGDGFVTSCLSKFKSLDKDSNGSLDPLELYPVILEMTEAHHYAIDVEHCKRFTDIFDDERTGVISSAEFVNFARFLMVTSYLQTEDGKKTMALAAAGKHEKAQKALPAPPPPPTSAVPPAVSHMVVDLDFYKNKSAKLAQENEDLRSNQFRLEDTIRRLQTRLEDQEQRLRHAELDLSAAGKPMR